MHQLLWLQLQRINFICFFLVLLAFNHCRLYMYTTPRNFSIRYPRVCGGLFCVPHLPTPYSSLSIYTKVYICSAPHTLCIYIHVMYPRVFELSLYAQRILPANSGSCIQYPTEMFGSAIHLDRSIFPPASIADLHCIRLHLALSDSLSPPPNSFPNVSHSF